jgi:hypothetical protein
MRSVTPKPENLAQLVFFVRGEKVMLDADLAMLYGVETGAINRAVKRNVGRFPEDFMFRLTSEDWENLKCQFGISSSSGLKSTRDATRPRAVAMADGREPNSSHTVMRSRVAETVTAHGGRRGLPYAFTEQGVAMLSSVLRSSRAVEVNIAIMRTFVQLRRLMDSNRDLARKIEAMEKKYDEQFAVVFDAIKQLIAEDAERKAQPKRRIGFTPSPSIITPFQPRFTSPALPVILFNTLLFNTFFFIPP